MIFRLSRTPRFIQWVFPRMTWGFSCNESGLYLTFDDGPDPEVTPWILDVLKAHDAKATFFCVGDRAIKYAAIYNRIIEEGHSVGNHTMYHERGTQTTDLLYLDSVDEAARIINSGLFRPPYGRIRNSQVRELRRRNMQVIMWSWLTYDFDHSYPVGKILKKARSMKAGDIIVLHDNQKCGERVKAILPGILAEGKRQGFAFEPIPQGSSISV